MTSPYSYIYLVADKVNAKLGAIFLSLKFCMDNGTGEFDYISVCIVIRFYCYSKCIVKPHGC